MIYTTGYSKRGWIPETLLIEARRLDAIVVDIRFKPYSRRSEWSCTHLRLLMGKRWYFVCQALGNRNYKGGPIEIADPSKGMSDVGYIIGKGSGVILLCGCRDLEGCHRQIVGNLLAECFEMGYEEISPPLS